MPSIVDADEPLTVSSLPYDLDPIVDMVIYSVGLLEPDLSTPNVTLDMVSFQSVFLPSNEDLLEAMTEFYPLTWCPYGACPLGIHDQEDIEDSFCISEATSLKNETEVFEHSFIISSSLKNETTSRIVFSSLRKPH
jgi:hypothetical protein